ncbi:MAG: DNA topoisomerase 3 [Planctomycetota bacterium]
MKVVLAEKPSVARDLAGFLGARARRDGYLEGEGYQVTWAFGHLVTLQEPDDYDSTLKRWTLEALPIVPDVFRLKLTGDDRARQQFEVVKGLMLAADELICATDAGREGELIFRYIVEMAKCTDKPISRLWLSSLTEIAIRDAFSKLRPGSDYDSLHDAARSRSEADWIVGMNATRAYTVRYGRSGVLWSVGRVQTPVLALIARRDDEIRHFVSEPWFEVRTRYREVVFNYRGDRFSKEDDAKQLVALIVDKSFTVDRVEGKEEKVPPPQLFDLTALQREMNTRYGISAADTLNKAQALYEGKAITYPRTDSRYLTSDMRASMPALFRKIAASYKDAVDGLDLAKLSASARIFADNKVTDHHAIIPTGRPPRDSTDRRVYDAIVIRTIAVFYPPCKKDVTIVDGRVEGVKFRARGVRVTDPGWTALYPKPKAGDKDSDAEQELPRFERGEMGEHTPEIKKGETRPPPHFTENSLLGAMETAGKLVEEEHLKEALKARGLGTPATRAAIIETLLRRRYIRRDKNTLTVTDLGRYLVALIQDPILKSAELTGEWEAKLKAIEGGELARDVFMGEIGAFTDAFLANGDASRFDGARIGGCPRCGADVIEGRRAYGCSKWKEGCEYVLQKDYESHEIQPRQASELLQRRISLRPVRVGEQPSILCLTDAGRVLHVAQPAREHQKAPPKAKRKAPAAPKPKRNGAAKTSEGACCPLCNAPMIERDKSYSCSAHRTGCRFVIWKEIAGKKITKPMAMKLLTKGKTQVLKGFRSKSDKKFDARLKLEDGCVGFEFE